MSLYTAQYVPVEAEGPETETGWERVQAGINRVLFSYLIGFGGCVLLGVILGAMGAQLVAAEAPGEGLVELAVVLVCCAALGLLLLWCFCMILYGKWLCALYAPERCWARALMFAAMTFWAMGPALGVASVFIVRKPSQVEPVTKAQLEDLEKLMEEHAVFTLDSPYQVLNLVSSLIGVAGEVLFVLFLRAVACCFERQQLIDLIDYYLVFMGIVFVGSLVVMYGYPKLLLNPWVILALGGGSLLVTLGYLAVLGLTSAAIQTEPVKRDLALES